MIELKRGYDLPERDRRPGATPVVSSSGPSGWHNEAKAAAPGVVTGRYGTIGEVFYVDRDFWPLNTTLYVADFKGADPRFVAYLLKTIPWSRYVDKGAVPGVNRNHVHLEPVVVPAIAEQRRIAAILGALDDKIELNRRMSRTLEEIAQTIFKAWFIDFDGCDDLVESESGPIPRGWRVGCLADVAQLSRSTIDPGALPPETPYIGLADMPQGSVALDTWGRTGDATSAKVSFAEGDLLFGKLRPYFKKVGVAPCAGVCSSDILVVVPRQPRWHGFTLGVLTQGPFIDYTSATATGTGMPRTSWATMARYRLTLPVDAEADRFEEIASSIRARIQLCIHESRTLAALRDLLLPKLISGELRVPEAEKAVEAVT